MRYKHFFLLISIFIIIGVKVNAQTWLYNSTSWVYKYENIGNLITAQKCVDNKLTTYSQNEWGQPNDVWYLPASIYFDLGRNCFLKDFRMNCNDAFPFSTIDNFQLYFSNSATGPWIAALNIKMPSPYATSPTWYNYSFSPQAARFWKVTFQPRNKAVTLYEVGFGTALIPYTISIPDSSFQINQTIEIPVKTSEVKASNNVISYQLKVNYDATKLQYIDNSLSKTIAKSGVTTVNSSIAGILLISYMTSNPLDGVGSILKLQFNPIQIGKSELKIYDFIYNTDTIVKIKNGIINVGGQYGDIEANNSVQAFDAALALQYSIGLDPLDYDPLPWEAWRAVVSNVDGIVGVTANDASLILQYSAGIISAFPVEGSKEMENALADIEVKQVNNELEFTSTGDLFGLNISVSEITNVYLGKPEVLDANLLSATNISGDKYNIGLCAVYSPADNTKIMKIPFTSTGNGMATIKMIINKNLKTNILLIIVHNPQ